jgi:hypothetical protein
MVITKIITVKSPIRSSVPAFKNENGIEEETFASVGITEDLRMRAEQIPKRKSGNG